MSLDKKDLALSGDTESGMSREDYGFPARPTIAQRRCWANQERFLAAFRRLGSMGSACAEAGVPVSTAEAWDSKDIYGFRMRKQEAGTIALGDIEREINRRAIEGTDRVIYYRGQVIGSYKEYSDNLLMFRAKRLDPAYRDNYQVTEEKPNTITQINIHLHPSVKPPGGEAIELGFR